MPVGDRYQGPGVLGETRAAISGTRVEEVKSNPPVIPHTQQHVPGVGTHRFAEVGHGIGERDPRGQIGVGAVFDHLGRNRIGHDHRCIKAAIEFDHDLGGVLAPGTDDDPIRMEEIRNRASFAKELGV